VAVYNYEKDELGKRGTHTKGCNKPEKVKAQRNAFLRRRTHHDSIEPMGVVKEKATTDKVSTPNHYCKKSEGTYCRRH